MAISGTRAGIVLSLFVAACASGPADEERGSATSRETTRWTPPQSDARGTYEGLNGQGCAGQLRVGARALGDALRERFSVSYGGYACRRNTANASELSIHAVGRALDVMATGETGESIANFAVEHATELGVTLIIWNRTLWKITPTGPTSRAYTARNPHTDHVHVEISSAAAARTSLPELGGSTPDEEGAAAAAGKGGPAPDESGDPSPGTGEPGGKEADTDDFGDDGDDEEFPGK